MISITKKLTAQRISTALGYTPSVATTNRYKVTKTFADFQPNGGLTGTLSGVFTLPNPPVTERIRRVLMVLTETFTGGTITASTLDAGLGTPMNAFITIDRWSYQEIVSSEMPSIYNINLDLVVEGVAASINSLTQGAVTIYVETDIID